MASPDGRLLEPVEGGEDTFVDALLGAFRFLQELDAPVAGDAPNESVAEPPAAAGTQADPLVDALLGLLSFRKTFGLLFEAVLGPAAEPRPAAGELPTWSREVLR